MEVWFEKNLTGISGYDNIIVLHRIGSTFKTIFDVVSSGNEFV